MTGIVVRGHDWYISKRPWQCHVSIVCSVQIQHNVDGENAGYCTVLLLSWKYGMDSGLRILYTHTWEQGQKRGTWSWETWKYFVIFTVNWFYVLRYEREKLDRNRKERKKENLKANNKIGKKVERKLRKRHRKRERENEKEGYRKGKTIAESLTERFA